MEPPHFEIMAAEPRAQHHSAGRRPSSMVAATGLPSAPSSSSRTAPAQVGAAGGPAADIPSMEHSSHRADSSGELTSSARSSSTPYLSSLAPTTTEPSALRSSFGAYGRQQRVTVDLHDRDFELYDDDDDDEDLDDELASRRGEFYEFLSDGGRKAGPSSGKSALLGGSRRRRPRYGISLDEQRAPPPAPISTATDYMLQSRPLSPPAARPLSALSQHALPFTNSPSSASSHKSLPFSNTAGQSAMLPNADNSLPLPETSNTLRKSERRTQVKRSHKLAQVLGQEVLVDDDRLERGSGSSQTTALNPIAAGLNAVAAKIERAKTGGETTLQALRKGNDTDRRSPPIAAMISGGSGSATTTALNHGSAGRYPAGHTHLNQAGPSQARSPAPTELGAASSKREGTTAESSLHAPILLRRRSRSAQNTQDRVDDSSHLLDDEHSLALSSIQATTRPTRHSPFADQMDAQRASFVRAPVSHTLPTRRSLESIRTMATISTFAESTVSTLDEAAQEERAQFVQREERRKRVAKMSRWLGVVVPPELVTSPGHNQAQQTGGTFSSSSSSPNLDRPRDSIDPSPAFSSHLHGPHGVTHLSSAAGLGAALQSVSSEEMKQRMAKVAGRLIKLGSTPMGTSNSAGTSSATGTNAVRAGGRLAALDLSGASTSAGSYKQLRPPNLDLSEAQHDRLHHFGNASAPMDPNDLLTPVSRVNVLSPRERIAIVKRANKLEKVFGEAPPHGMLAALPHNLEGPGGRRRSLHQHSNSAPITPHGFGLSGVSSQFAHSTGDMAFQAALKDLLVSVPPSSASTRHRQHHPYAASITSSPRSMRSTYATSIASLEYLLDNDVPLLNDMMTALEEEEGSDTPGHSAPGSARQSLEGSRPATALGITTKSENVATPSASKELPDRAPEPKSPDTPGSSHRRHRSLMSPTQNNSHFEISRPESSGGADAASTIDHAELKALTPAALFRRRSESATEDPSQLSPLQTAPWDLFDGSASSAYHFGLSNVGDNLDSPGTSYEAGRASHLSASPALGVAGGSGAGSPAFALSADRRASLISHLSRLSSTPSLSTLSSISPPGSPRDPISAEHDFRRQRALRAQKLGRFFGAEPSAMPSALVHGLSGGGAGAGASLMPDLFGNANSADSTSAGTNHVMARSSSVGGSALGASFTGAVATGDTTSSIGPHSNLVTPTRTIFPPNPVASVSSGIANHFQGGTDGPGPSTVRTRRLAPRSAGSAKPQTSFIRMLRSLEEEAMEDETLTPVELKAIRARLNAMRRRGEEGSARLLDGDIVI